MTETVGKLRRELGETERTQSRMATTMQRLKGLGGIATGVVGAGMVLRKPIEDTASYDAELRKQANFAYSNSDLAGRTKGMSRIERSIRSGVTDSGSSIEDAFAGLETMQRSGLMTRDQSFKYLPNVLKNSVATGADAASVANLQASSVNFGLKDKDAEAALSVATTMAQHGRVDVPLLAREMPRGLEAAKSAGFYGQRGFSQIAALYEASAIGAKDPVDATTNTNDLLAELTSRNLTHSAKRIKVGGRKLDIMSMMRKDMAQNMTPLDTVTHVIGAMDKNDPLYRRYQNQLGQTTDAGAREKLNAQLMQIHGQHISQLFPNQQSRNAYINYDRNREVFNRLTDEGVRQFSLPEGQRSADLDSDLVRAGDQWKIHQGKNAATFAGYDAMKKPTGWVANITSEAAKLGTEFPKVAAAASLTTTSIRALGGAALSVAGVKMVVGGAILKRIFKKEGSAVEGAATGAGETAASGAAAGAGEAAASGAGAAGEVGGQIIKPLSKLAKIGVVGDIMMGLSQFYTEFLERGKDKVAENGGVVPEGMPQPVGALDVFDELRAFFKKTDTPDSDKKVSDKDSAKAAPVIPPINIYLDSQLVTERVLLRVEYESRRHGA
jgi:hypothetical protein